MKGIKVGDLLPEFELKNDEGEAVRLSPDRIEGPVVVYFYPKDDTPGCTAEACSFRDAYEDFTSEGVNVYGVSSDSVEKHRQFKAKHRLPFTLLADESNALRKAFGVPSDLFGLLPGRVTYVFDSEGVCRKVFKSQFNATKHISEALEALRGVVD